MSEDLIKKIKTLKAELFDLYDRRSMATTNAEYAEARRLIEAKLEEIENISIFAYEPYQA